MAGIFRAFVPLLWVAIVFSPPARGEDLAMPYACSVERGSVRLEPAAETTYAILGKRDQQPFTVCRGGGAPACEQVMVHRFMIACGGERVSWAGVAAAARISGVVVPPGLPLGFAPVTVLGGRFQMPALPHSTALVSRVTAVDLSPDSVMERIPVSGDDAGVSTWAPVVKAEMDVSSGGGAMRMALAIGFILATLFVSCMLAAGRWQVPRGTWSGHLLKLQQRCSLALGWLAQTSDPLRKSIADWLSKVMDSGPEDMHRSDSNAIAIAMARLADARLRVGVIPADLLLRDVLKSELERVEQRITILERDGGRLPEGKAASLLRSILQELDRIGRIADSAVHRPHAGADQEAAAVPGTLSEAYCTLGLNANAPAEVAKRLVDALRMSWHPDHASDDADRRRREARIKQINAAWDIVNGRREAA